MTDTQKPIGELFTHAYLERGDTAEDGELFRRRLGGYVQSKLYKDHAKLNSFLKLETGLTVKVTALKYGAYNHFEEFFVSIPIQKLLDIITLIWRFLWGNHAISRAVNGKITRICNEAENWHAFVTRVFNEENLGYMLDARCGVHFLVDEEFERNRASLISCLDFDRYAGVKEAFENSHRYLDSSPPDTKASVRAMFESIEILVKLMVETKNLNKWIVESTLKEKVLTVFGDDETARNTVSLSFDGFANWVHGLHNYRHGQGKEGPVAPPLDFTIYVLSSGAAFLRWLAGLDQELLQSNNAN